MSNDSGPVMWPEYNNDRMFIKLSQNMTSMTSYGTRFGEPATSFWTMLVPVLLESSRTRVIPYNHTEVEKEFTALGIPEHQVEAVVLTLLFVGVALLILAIVLAICVCKYIL